MKRLFAILAGLMLVSGVFAQNFKDAGEYLDYINQHFYDINKAMWKYLKVSAHSSSQRRQLAKKQDFVKTIEKTRREIAQMPPFEGDASLRDSIVAYLDFAKAFVNGDLTRLEELQAVSTKSYEAMVRYLQKEAEVNRKYEQRFKAVDKLLDDFARSHNINLVQATDKLSQKIDKANKAYEYNNKLFLIYFKPYMTATYLYKAIGEDDPEKISAFADSLLRDVARGKTLLAATPDFEGDDQLKYATGRALSAFKSIVLDYLPQIYEFYDLKKQISQLDSVLHSKTQDQWTQEEVDRYNSLVEQYNKKVQEVNPVIEQIRQIINNTSSEFAQAQQQFLDYHVPR